MNATALFGLMAAALGVAAFSVAIVNGGNTANVIGAGTKGFASIIRAATLQKG